MKGWRRMEGRPMRLKPKFGIIATLIGALMFAAMLASAHAAENIGPGECRIFFVEKK